MLCFYQQTLISPPPCLTLLLFVCLCVCICVRVSYDKCAVYQGVCVCAFLWVCACGIALFFWQKVPFWHALNISAFMVAFSFSRAYSCWPALNVTVLHNRQKYTKKRRKPNTALHRHELCLCYAFIIVLHAASLCQKETFWFSCLITPPFPPRHFPAGSFYLIKDKHKWPDIKSALYFIGTQRATSRSPISTASPPLSSNCPPLHTFLNLVVLLKQFNAASASAASKDKLMTLGPWLDAIVRSVNAYPVGLSVCLSACLTVCLSV